MMNHSSQTFVTRKNSTFVYNLLRWFVSLDINFLRINIDDKISKFKIQLSEDHSKFEFILDKERYSLNLEEKNYFLHQGVFQFSQQFSSQYFKNRSHNLSFSLSKIIFTQSSNYGTLPEELNFKLYNLYLAKRVGLSIPHTVIGDKDSLQEEVQGNSEEYISKAITNVFKERYQNGIIVGPGTVLVNERSFNRDEINFSLIQKKISKFFDIRTVYYDNQFFSIAIFTPKNQNITDFRNLYNQNTPNPKNVPFELPNQVKEKLATIAEKLDLKFCSFDLIYSKKNEYVFIEVNPEGVIDWVSRYGNFGIYRHIAKKYVAK